MASCRPRSRSKKSSAPARPARPLRSAATLCPTGRVGRVADAADLDGVPVHGHAVAAVGADLLELVPDPLAGRPVPQPGEQGVGPARRAQLGSSAARGGAAGQVRVGVEA